jgi:hypothetical protein
MMPMNSPARLTDGLPELPPMMSAVLTKLNSVARLSADFFFSQRAGSSKSPLLPCFALRS